MTATSFDLPAKYHYALAAGSFSRALERVGDKVDLMELWRDDYQLALKHMAEEEPDRDVQTPLESVQSRWRA